VAEVEQIAAYVSEDPQRNTVEIDLEAQKVSLANGSTFTFNVNPYHKRLLLEGADPIALTMSFGAKIDQYLAADQQHRPWLY